MIDLLKRSGGVHFKNSRTLPLTDLRPVRTSFEWLHAESATGFGSDVPRKVAVSFGPRHAPVTPKQVLDAIRETRGYDIVLFVGFACDPEALGMIERGTSDRVFQFVHAAPDILVGDLVKTSKTTKLFTVFGLPDVNVKKEKNGEVTVTLTGVDIYDPVTGETNHDDGKNVAASDLLRLPGVLPGRQDQEPLGEAPEGAQGGHRRGQVRVVAQYNLAPVQAGQEGGGEGDRRPG
jgi:adenine-specific DNA-methyltransferase